MTIQLDPTSSDIRGELRSILDHPSTQGRVARAIDRHPTDQAHAAIQALEEILGLELPAGAAPSVERH